MSSSQNQFVSVGHIEYVDPSSSIGQLIVSMNEQEELNIIESIKKTIENAKKTSNMTENAIIIRIKENVNAFMNLYQNRPFKTLLTYLATLDDHINNFNETQ